MALPREQIREHIRNLLYGQGHDVRFTQDSPVLPDVWAEYAERPNLPVDLLLTPFQDRGSTSLGPARLAAALEESLQRGAGRSEAFRRARRPGDADHQIAVNQTTVVVRLWFDELVRVVLPLSSWWHSRLVLAKADQEPRNKALGALEKMKTAPGRRWLAGVFAAAEEGHPSEVTADLYWTLLVVGAIAMSNYPRPRPKAGEKRCRRTGPFRPPRGRAESTSSDYSVRSPICSRESSSTPPFRP